MTQKTVMKPISIALGAAFITSLAGTSVANAAENPFGMTDLSSGYMVAADKEGKCGEGKCGGDKKGMKDKKEGKCGEGKCGEGKCGGDKKGMKDKKEGKCGEGKCGGDKKGMKDKKEGKCGEGKCGGDK